MADGQTPLQEIAEENELLKNLSDGIATHQALARGYDSTGAHFEEMRELTRGIFYQNQMLIILAIRADKYLGS